MWHNSRRATQLGKFTLLHNVRRATTQLSRFSLRGTADGCRATTQLDRLTLSDTTAAELHDSVVLLCDTTAAAKLNNPVSLMRAPGVAVTNRTEKYEDLVQSKILLNVLNALEDSTNRSVVDLQQTLEICKLYEDK